MWVFWSVALGSAECAEETTNATLGTRLEQAAKAYEDLDESGFTEAVRDTTQLIGCLSEPIEVSLAAAYHRFNALEAFSHRDIELTERSFAAARSAQPHFQFPVALVPEGSPVRTHYNALELDTLVMEVLPDPVAGEVLLDGVASRVRALPLPVVYQRTEGGTVVESAVLAAHQLPAYAVGEKRRVGVNVPLLLAGGALAAAGGGLVAASFVDRAAIVSDLEQGTEKYPDRASLDQRLGNTRLLRGFGVGGLIAGGAVGVGAVLVGNL